MNEAPVKLRSKAPFTCRYDLLTPGKPCAAVLGEDDGNFCKTHDAELKRAAEKMNAPIKTVEPKEWVRPSGRTGPLWP